MHEDQKMSVVDEVDASAKLFRQAISSSHPYKSDWSELSNRGVAEVMFDDDLSLSNRTAENTEIDENAEVALIEKHASTGMMINYQVNVIVQSSLFLVLWALMPSLQ